jgi:hypothetical protein
MCESDSRERGEVRCAASCHFLIHRFKQPHFRILAAQSVRGLPVPREPREGWSGGRRQGTNGHP